MTFQQLIRALMQKEEDDKPKQIGDLMSIADPSMIPSHEEGGGYSPSYHGDESKLYRSPTLDERLLLYPGQALESAKSTLTRPSDDPYESGITSLLGKIPEAAWSVLNPLLEQTGKDVTQAYSKISGGDQGEKLGAITSGVALASSLKGKGKGGRPPTRILDEYYMKGKGKDPHGRGKVGIQDNDYEPRITEIERMLSKLEPENLPQSRWKDNPQMTEDANNAVGKWRNMLEDLYTRALSNSEQVSAGVKPRDRLFTVPDGFDHEGNPAFKLLSDPEQIDTALAKTWFDIQRDMGRYFDFSATPDISDDEVSLTPEQQKLSDERVYQARADLDIFREGRLAHNNTSDHLLGRGTVYYDKLGVARVQPGTSAGMLEDPKRISFVEASEDIALNEEMERVNKAWDDYGSFTASKMDNGRPQIADLYNEHGVRYRLSNKSDVEGYLTMARDGPRTYLIENFNNDLQYLHGDEMKESFIEVDKALSDWVNMNKKPLSRTEKSVGELAEFDLIHSLPTLTRAMAGQRVGRTGTMIVDQLMERSRINGSLASQMEILDDMLSPLSAEAKEGYKKSMDISVRQAIAEKAMNWMHINMGLSRNYLRDQLFRDILGLEEDVFAPYQPRH